MDTATNVLAIETTTEACSVALATRRDRFANSPVGKAALTARQQRTDSGHGSQHWFEDTRFAPRLHNWYLLGMIDGLLKAASLDRRALQVIAFGAGPGSFTGVRIGAAVAQGIALGTGARVVQVASSAVAAESLRRSTPRRGGVSLSRTSRPGWSYVARYELGDDGVRCMEFDELVVDADIDERVVDVARSVMSARIVGELALASLASAGEPATAVPFYVEGDSPWRPTVQD